MTRRFELSDESSSKFWEITVGTTEIQVRWGRIGSNGRQTTKAVESPERATAEAAKLIRAKVRKGYREVEGVPGEVDGNTSAPRPYRR